MYLLCYFCFCYVNFNFFSNITLSHIMSILTFFKYHVIIHHANFYIASSCANLCCVFFFFFMNSFPHLENVSLIINQITHSLVIQPLHYCSDCHTIYPIIFQLNHISQTNTTKKHKPTNTNITRV